MKTMFMFDLLTAKKMLKSQVVLSVVVAVIFGVSTDMPLAIIPFMALMLAYATGFTLVAYDERNDWEKLRLTLPLSRADIIRGRYATFAAMTMAGIVLGGVLVAVLWVLAQLAPTAPVLSEFAGALDWQMAVAMVVSGVVFALVLWIIALPLVARYGMTKAVRFLPLAFVIVLPIATVLVQKAGPLPASVMDFVALGGHTYRHARRCRSRPGLHRRAVRAFEHAVRQAVREARVLTRLAKEGGAP